MTISIKGKETETDPNEIFQPEPIFNNLDIYDREFTLDEVHRAKKSLKDG